MACKNMNMANNKKFYGVAAFSEKRTINGKDLLSGCIKGKITKNSVLETQTSSTGSKYLRLSVSVQNQDKAFERYAKELGATAETYNSGDNAYNTVPVMVNGVLAENLPKFAHAGDEVFVSGDLVANTYNGKTTLQMQSVRHVEVTRRANAQNTDESTATKATKETKEEEVVEQPSFNTFDDEDTPF